jgi:hypothetical protein
MNENYYEQKLGKSQYQLKQEQREADRRARVEARKAQEEASRAALGGMTLSEALRTPEAQSSTRVRRQIKETYRKAREAQNSTGVDESFDDKGVNDSTVNTVSEAEESNFDINTYNEKSVIIVEDGFIETIKILTA